MGNRVPGFLAGTRDRVQGWWTALSARRPSPPEIPAASAAPVPGRWTSFLAALWRERSRLRRLPAWGYWPIAVVMLLGAALTYNAYTEVTTLARTQVEHAFQRAAQDRVLMVQREVEYSLSLVQDMASLFGASPNVSRRDFRRFVGPALRRQPAIHALQWVPWVPAAALKEFTAEARRGLPSFRVLERDLEGHPVKAGARAEYFPVLFVQPYKRNKHLLGYDLATDPRSLAALNQARTLGQMHVDQPVVIPDEGQERQGYRVYVPVYGKTDVPEAVSEDEDEEGIPGELRGFTIGSFCLEDVVERALGNLRPAGILMSFQARAADGGRQLLYTHRSRLHQEIRREPGSADWLLPPLLQPIRVGDQSWEVALEAEPGHYQVDTWNGVLVLVAGVAFTALLGIYIGTLVSRAEKVNRLVNQRTFQLQNAITALNKEIVERKRAENDLQGLNENLESIIRVRTQEADRRADELEQFAYVTSHDLKAPLRAVSNLATWIEEDLRGQLEEGTREQLVLLRDRVQRMHGLIEGLLEYSRVGHTRVADDPIDTGELLREVLDSLAPAPGFQIQLPPRLPRLRGDRLQLGQVFSNLIGNSLKHRGGRSGRIWIDFRDLGETVEFSVRDDGPGIAPEYHDKVFMMFQTLEIRDLGSSTGIGLALVKKIVQEQGGGIWLDSAEGQGATFTFTWPKGLGMGSAG